MVDKNLVFRKLADLGDLRGQLLEYRAITARRYAADWKTQRIVERTLQMMVESGGGFFKAGEIAFRPPISSRSPFFPSLDPGGIGRGQRSDRFFLSLQF